MKLADPNCLPEVVSPSTDPPYDPYEYIGDPECRQCIRVAFMEMRKARKAFNKIQLDLVSKHAAAIATYNDTAANDLLSEHAIVIHELDPDDVQEMLVRGWLAFCETEAERQLVKKWRP